MAGPVTSGALFLVTAVGLHVFGHAQFVWNPFGNGEDAGAPKLAGGASGGPAHPVWIASWFGYVNYVLMLANLIPALPFDGGRVFRAYLGSTSVVSSRDNIHAPMTARACACAPGHRRLGSTGRESPVRRIDAHRPRSGDRVLGAE